MFDRGMFDGDKTGTFANNPLPLLFQGYFSVKDGGFTQALPTIPCFFLKTRAKLHGLDWTATWL
jgi:hypothetical protein